MRPSQPNPVVAAAAAAAKSLMTMKAKNCLHLFAEGALSFFAFLLSIFIYVSVFNLSLSTDLLNDTKFWFCISNTLIFIIAADCGAFSPPPDFHGGGDRRRNKAAAEIPNQKYPEDNLKIIVREQPPNSGISTQEEEKIPHTTEISILPKFNSKKSYRRKSKSEKVQRVVEKERKITMRRSKTMIRHEASTRKEEEEKNEFTEMTDEELNRRVEEFIERFNKQIRLQETGHLNEK